MDLPDDRDALKREFLSWLNRNQRAHEAPIVRALDVVYDLDSSGCLSLEPDQQEALARGLELPYLLSFPLAGYIFELASEREGLATLLLDLAAHPQSKVRRNAMTMCLHNGPNETIQAMLLRGLSDRSKAVRLKAADVIHRTERRPLLSAVRRAAEVEAKSEVAQVLRWTADLLDKGWSRELFDHVTVSIPGGGVTGITAEPGDSDDDIARRVAAKRTESQAR